MEEQYRFRYWEDIEEGESLPSFEYELSLLRLVSFVRATGLYDYVHFDRDYAQRAGARDAFISTPHVAGLFTRLLTDWSGSQADILSMSFKMLQQSCVNDLLTVTGRVGRKYVDDRGNHLVDVIDMNIGHAHALSAAKAQATIAFPSRTRGLFREPVLGMVPAPPTPNTEVPEFVRPLMRKPQRLDRPVRPLTEDALHLWCESLEDWNPLYWDEAYASASRYGQRISPPEGNFFGTGSSASAGVGYFKPGETAPEAAIGGLRGLDLLEALRKQFLAANNAVRLPDFPEVVVVESHATYIRPCFLGDQLYFTQEITDCGPQKSTKLGVGHFFSILQCVYNQYNELVKTLEKKSFYYRPY